jgi:hypothetical protein
MEVPLDGFVGVGIESFFSCGDKLLKLILLGVAHEVLLCDSEDEWGGKGMV